MRLKIHKKEVRTQMGYSLLEEERTSIIKYHTDESQNEVQAAKQVFSKHIAHFGHRICAKILHSSKPIDLH